MSQDTVITNTMPLPLAIATGGMRDTALRLGNFTWGSFKDRLRKPQIGGKDGSYYIRGAELRQPHESKKILIALNSIGADVSFVEIITNNGHDSFLLDEPEFLRSVKGFLDSAYESFKASR
jgi:hypothetical protein